MLVQILLLIANSSPVVSPWHLEYVGKRLVMPIAMGTQEVLYCPCVQCYDTNLDVLMQWTQMATGQPQMVISQSSDYTVGYNDVKRNILTIVLMETIYDSIIAVHSKLLRGRHFYINILIMCKPIRDFTDIVNVLSYLHEQKFINSDVYYINGTTEQDEVFGFTSFPEFAVENKTHLVGDVRMFYSRIIGKTDVLGYRFETPLMLDPPKVIRYHDKNDQLRIQGVAYNILQMSLEYLNGTLIETTKTQDEIDGFVDMQYVLGEVRQHNLELAAHAYALFHSDQEIQKSYPLLVVDWCLMIPIANRDFSVFYPFTPFSMPVWLTILVAFVLVNSVTYLFLRRHNVSTDNFVLVNFCKFINVPPPMPGKMLNQRWLDRLLNGFIFSQGFFLAAFYTSMLGSFLAVTVIRKHINSIPELIDDNIPVMIIDYELDFLLKEGLELPPKFMGLLRPVSSKEFYQHQLNLNKSFAYFTTYDNWHFLDIQQQHLRPPLFRYSDICFGNYHLAFPMVADSPIWRDMEYLTFRIHSSGLYSYHEKKSFEYAVSAGLVKHKIAESSYQTVGFAHLRIVVGFLIVGAVLAFASFLYEWWKYRRENRRG